MKKVFVFGAGASNDSGRAPLGKDLGWRYFEDCSTMYKIGVNGKTDPRDIEEKNKLFSTYGLFLKSAGGIFPDLSKEYDNWQRCMNDWQAYESVHVKKYYIDEILAELLKRDKTEYFRLIKQLIAEHISESTRMRKKSKPSLYEAFLGNLKGLPCQEISIISLNFDCLLSEDWQQKIYIDYLIDFDSVDPHRSSYAKGRGFPLIKLNGSLDWAWDPNTNSISLRHPFITRETYKLDGPVEPYIFLPHQQKVGKVGLLWDRAKEEIRSATKITIIGYSFPKYDTDVINLFAENLNPETEIEVIDIPTKDPFGNDLRCKHRKREIMRRYKELFPDAADPNIFLHGFRGFIERFCVSGASTPS